MPYALSGHRRCAPRGDKTHLLSRSGDSITPPHGVGSLVSRLQTSATSFPFGQTLNGRKASRLHDTMVPTGPRTLQSSRGRCRRWLAHTRKRAHARFFNFRTPQCY